ncbi:MAG: iron-sulfur cluster assembly accessory protein [Candidatus Aenigmarchaeota archaeon]|nr:iron-sulfur cluster assembly accessory protein [Candidatus Aenigmarchaeota archaeon]
METQTQSITKDMTMGEIIEKFPFASEVMLSYGLHCVGCHVNPYESLENGALGHGMSDEEVNSMLQELNDLVKTHAGKAEALPKDAKITITEFAARKINEIMKTQHKDGYGLRVEVARGGCAGYTYNMDFEKTHSDDDFVFEEHGVRMFVTPKSMEFLNGTQIDYTEGLQGAGFKLNNPNVKSSCGCGKSVH